MSAVWKFALPVEDTVDVKMPAGAHVLSVAVQNGCAWLWAVCDPSAERETRSFYVRGTGHPLGDAEGCTFVGTFMLYGGGFVGHVFEAKR